MPTLAFLIGLTPLARVRLLLSNGSPMCRAAYRSASLMRWTYRPNPRRTRSAAAWRFALGAFDLELRDQVLNVTDASGQ